MLASTDSPEWAWAKTWSYRMTERVPWRGRKTLTLKGGDRLGAELIGSLRYYGMVAGMGVPSRMAVTRLREERMTLRTYGLAVKQAKGLARLSNRAYVVFTDTSGNWRCEPYDPGSSAHREGEVVFPDSGNESGR